MLSRSYLWSYKNITLRYVKRQDDDAAAAVVITKAAPIVLNETISEACTGRDNLAFSDTESATNNPSMDTESETTGLWITVTHIAYRWLRVL